MHAFQIITAPSTRSANPFQPAQALAIAQPIPPVQLDSIRFMIDNSRLGWPDKSKFRKALESLVTVNAANQLQEHLLEEIARAEITEKAELRRLIAETIRENPEFFSDTWYGQQEVDSCWHHLTSAQTPWLRLHEDYVRVKQAVEVWVNTKGLVDQALVDGEKLQAQMRKETRDPALNLEEEKDMVCRLAVELLAAAQHPASNYPVQQTMRQLCEVVQDSDEPKQLVTTMSRAFEALLNY